MKWILIAMAAIIGGLVAGLVYEIEEATVLTMIVASFVALIIIYMWAPQMKAIPLVTLLVSSGMYLSVIL